MKAFRDLNKDLTECTFSPHIIEFKNNPGESLDGIKGIEKYLQRKNLIRSSINKIGISEIQQKNKELTAKEYLQAVKGLNDYLHSINIE